MSPREEASVWSARAESLARSFPTARLSQRVLLELSKSPTAAPWGLGFSGGADSLALLLLVWAHFPDRRSSILTLHFDHKLRGAESDADAFFCREVCTALGLRLIEGLAVWADGPEGVSEAMAREARHRFFKNSMSEAGSRHLLLGHQKDDVAETLLMRLARGSGAAGLAAPRPVSRHGSSLHLRPLLDLSHEELCDGLRKCGATWREDETNSGDRYFRSRIRSSVIPVIQQVAPTDFLGGAARSRELLEEDDDALEAWADRIAPNRGLSPLLISTLRDCPKAVARRVLHRWLAAHEGGDSLGRTAFDLLLNDLRSGARVRCSAGCGAFVISDGVGLNWEAGAAGWDHWHAFEFQIPGRAILADGGVLEAEVVSLDESERQRVFSGESSNPLRVYLGFDGAPPPWLAVRPWKPGDRYASLGSEHDSKLQDHFVNRRIPKRIRHRLPVLSDSVGCILWVPGLPPTEAGRVQPNDPCAVRLTYLPSEPLFDPTHV